MRPFYKAGLFLMVAIACMFGGSSKAEAKSVFGFAMQLNREGGLRHDVTARRPEIVFKSSGRATKQAARAAWARSTSGHAQILPGVLRIRCVGKVCVAR